MCNADCVIFAAKHLTREEAEGKAILEVGALDVNGSLRPLLESFAPRAYVGVDIAPGPGVDVICGAERLVERFGRESFDLVLSTELLEHVRDWRAVISNMKQILRTGGRMLITTRSLGFGYHAYPHDYWRYELEDMRRIFADLAILNLEQDPRSPGVFMKAAKPPDFKERDLTTIELYSMVHDRRAREITDRDLRNPHYLGLLWREQAKQLVSRAGWRKLLSAE